MACELTGNKLDWDLLSQRFAEISFLLSTGDIPFLEVSQDSQGYFHAVGRKGALHEKDVAQEVLSWKSEIFWEGIDVLYVYGVGLGAYYSIIKEWLSEKKERVCIFLEEDLSVLQALFCLPIGLAMLQNPQVHFRFVADPLLWDQILDQCALEWMSDRVEFAFLASYGRNQKKKMQSLRLKLLRKSTLVHIGISESLHYHVLMENIIANFFETPQSFHVNKLKDVCKGIPAIICGAGVSLSEVVESLRKLEQRALVIAGGSTITALSHMGIRPHIAMALDPNDEEYERLKASSSFEIPFIFSARLCKDVLTSTHVKSGYLCSDTGGPFESWMQQKLSIDPDSLGPELGAEALSVTTLAIPLARYLGCRKVLLCGVDLSYRNMQRYPSGVLPSAQVFLEELKAEKRSMEKVIYRKNYTGKSVTSLVKWAMEASCIGSYVKQHPDMQFFSASGEGLKISGVSVLPIEEFILQYCQRQYDMRGLLQAESELARFVQFSEKKVEEVLVELAASLKQSLELFEDMHKEIERKLAQDASHPAESGLMSLLEMDLQQQEAFAACLQYTFPAYQRILERYYPGFSPVETEEGRHCFLEKKKKLWQECHRVTKACLVLVNKSF